jgi:hypothetical protein
MVVLVGLVSIAAMWFAWGAFDRPQAAYEVGDSADGRRAQQKLFELSGRVTSRAGNPRRASVTFSERELNALLARHVGGELPLSSPAIRLVGNGVAEISGRLPLPALLGEPVLVALRRVGGDRFTGQPVWLRVRGHVRLESGGTRGDFRRLSLEPESAWIGSRPLPAAVLTVLPDGPARRATRWAVPATVDSVVVEPGRLTLGHRP